MVERRPSNSERRLQRIEREQPSPRKERGILEIFDEPLGFQDDADADAALARDDDADDPKQ